MVSTSLEHYVTDDLSLKFYLCRYRYVIPIDELIYELNLKGFHDFKFLSYNQMVEVEGYFLLHFPTYKRFSSPYIKVESLAQPILVSQMFQSLKKLAGDFSVGSCVCDPNIFRHYPATIVDIVGRKALLEYKFNLFPNRSYFIWSPLSSLGLAKPEDAVM